MHSTAKARISSPRTSFPRASFGRSTFAFLMLSLATTRLAATPASAPPQRIVALGGAITETLYALGEEQKIVGVDTTSLYPPDALRAKPNVGYFRAFSAEGVLSLKPTLVIAASAAGPEDSIKLLEESKVAVARLPDNFTAEGVESKITTLGHLTGTDAKAATLAKTVAQGFAQLATLRAKVHERAHVLFIIAMQGGRPLVAGTGTAADAVIALAGGVNVAQGFAGYKQMSDESIVAAQPDVVVMMANGKPPAPGEIFSLPAFKTTPAAAHGRLVALDGLYLLGFGPRTPQAAKDLFAAFYPGLK
ncbi:hemin ABC transporter substrate-binding protein [Methylovirgula ligni]|nr:hemin ABC transporter substrate-binding protein [Methylovirgula ligni]